MVSSFGKALDVHVFQDDANIVGNVLENLTQVHRMLQTRLAPQVESDDEQNGVYPEHKADDAAQLLQLFLFPNSLKPKNLDSDSIQVCMLL